MESTVSSWLLAVAVAGYLVVGLGLSLVRSTAGASARRWTTVASWLALIATVGASAAFIARFERSITLVQASLPAHLGLIGVGSLVNPLTMIVVTLVAFVGTVVVRYSTSYLRDDVAEVRFYRWLNVTLGLFLWLIVTNDVWTFWLLFVAASLSLHELLVLYRDRPLAVTAARKNFALARLADASLFVALVLVVSTTGRSSFSGIAAWFHEAHPPIGLSLEVAAGLIALTAVVKSGVFPFHGWLIQVMEAPTQVSALLHAGLIYAGAFLLLRMSWLVAAVPWVWVVLSLAVIGVFVSSLMMLTETNIKEALAYSTSAQLAFMMMECGLGLYSVAVLHIVAHSVYKAHAFLSSGSVVDAHRGAIVKKTPVRRTLVQVEGALAISALVMAGIAEAMRVDIVREPTLAAIGFVVAVAMTQLLLQGFTAPDRAGRRLLLRAGGLSLLVGVAYFGLHDLMVRLLGTTVPSESGQAAHIPAWVLAVVVLAFVALLHIQQFLGPLNRTRFGRWLYVALWNGLWVDAAMRRLAWFDHLRLGDRPVSTIADGGSVATRGVAGAPKTASAVLDSARSACDRIAPVWPLRHFVAVNPYFGMRDLSFWDADRYLQTVAGSRLVMPLAYYREQLRRGRISPRDVRDAARRLGRDGAAETILARLDDARADAVLPRLPLFSDHLGQIRGRDVTTALVERLSHFSAAYFDEGQATWHLPWQGASLWQAWRAAVQLDATPRILGLPWPQSALTALAKTPEDAIAAAVRILGIPDEAIEDYFVAALFSIGGWAAWARYRRWQAELIGSSDSALFELLAIRVSADAILAQGLGDPAVLESWRVGVALAHQALAASRHDPLDDAAILHAAFELHYRRALARTLAGGARGGETPDEGRPRAQLAFCIDVRSEGIRRAVESSVDGAQTLGFAGFFGVQMEYVPFGTEHARAHLPVIFAPPYRVREDLVDASDEVRARAAERRRLRLGVSAAWKAFKSSAASTFTFVESTGLLYVPKLFGDAMGWSRTVAYPDARGLAGDVHAKLRPRLTPLAGPGGSDGIPEERLAEIGRFILTSMGLTSGFAPLVVLVGHGSETVNNPQGSGLDCGACGGQSGEASAKVAAALLNDPRTREGLSRVGIEVPSDTVFLAALHSTLTEEVTLFDVDALDPAHRALAADLQAGLAGATRLAATWHATALGLTAGRDPGTDLERRGRDWAEVRPEWGLIDNAAFIAAPRARTSRVSLDGRAFLHDYDWHHDTDFATLTLVMTAPMVVANWINLQYYASMVDNRRFGSGTKVLHNVVGGSIGVLEGNNGDLRVGLALQSLHDGTRWLHEPVRLTVVIEAPRSAIDQVVREHQIVSDLVEHGWLFVTQLEPDGTLYEREADGRWNAVIGDDSLAATGAR